MTRRIYAFLTAVVLLCCMGMSVSAHEVPNLEENGTITFIIQWGEEKLDDGTLTLYRVGDIVEENGNFGFALIPELAGSDLSLEKIDDQKLAEDLAKLAKAQKLEALTEKISEGKVCFEDVEPGLYVAVQNEVSDGFEPLSPFVISMPLCEGGEYLTDFEAKPKVSLEQEPTESVEPPTTKPKDPTLPQTGQLNWPVPVLVVSGLFLFVLGWGLCFAKGKDTDEA